MWVTPFPLYLVQSKRMENLNLNKGFKVTAFYSLPKLHTAALILHNTSTILHSTPCPPRRDVFEIHSFHTLHEAFIHIPYINTFNMSKQLCNEECTNISAGKLVSDTNYTMKVSFWPDFYIQLARQKQSLVLMVFKISELWIVNRSSNHDRNKPKLVVTTELSLILSLLLILNTYILFHL